MIGAQVVEVIKGLPNVKKFFLERDKDGKPTDKVVDYRLNDIVIVGEAPVERGDNDLAISVDAFNTVPNNARNQLGGPNTNKVATLEIGLIVRKMNGEAKRVTKKGKQQLDTDGKPIVDTAYILVMSDIQGLHQNIKPFRDLPTLDGDPKPKFRIEAIKINGLSDDSSDEGPHYHHFKFEFEVDFDAKEFLTPTSN